MRDHTSTSRRSRYAALIGLAAAAAFALAGCASNSSGSPTTASSDSSGTSTPPTSTAPSTSLSAAAATKPVHVSLQLSDGSQVGVGMPVIAYLSRPITDAKAFQAATKVTVNGQPAKGAWYFETKFGLKGKPIEADYRLQAYWPGHAQIHVDLPMKGVDAGPGLKFDDNLTLDFTTGPANILTVDDSTHMMTVLSDGVTWGTFPVSLGANNTPTKHGIKVIMEKGLSICMHGPGYNECGIKYTQRLTYDGEYLHAAPWNTYNIDHGRDSSNGCTNLHIADAKKLYDFLEIGDVVNYPNANGPHMALGDGYGDWNVPWGQWITGGLYPTGAS